MGIVTAVPLWGAALAVAQTSPTVTVSATVVRALAIEKTADLTFGSVAQGESKTVMVTDNEAGQCTIVGAPSSVVNVNYSMGSPLSDGSNTLAYTPEIAVSPSGGGAGATELTAGSGQITLSDQGTGYLMIGGTVSPSQEQPLGTYSADIVVSVAYP